MGEKVEKLDFGTLAEGKMFCWNLSTA